MTVLCDLTVVQDHNFRVENMTMKGLIATSWAKLQPVLWSSPSAVVPKTVGHSRTAHTRHLAVSKPRCYLALIVLASLTLATAAAADEDDKAYPGAMCQPFNNTILLLLDPNGRVLNGGPGEANVICPVVKDVTAERDPEFARITVIGEVSCTFNSRDQNGESPISISPNQTLLLPNSVVEHRFAAGDDNIPAGVANGYYYFHCVIPGFGPESGLSGIISYFVTEQDED